VVSERFSNTVQFSDNLTKVYKSHTFKGGYIYQDIFFGSTQPPYARGDYSWDGRYTSVINQADNTTARAAIVLEADTVSGPGGVDYAGGMNVIRVSPFGAVDAFKTYHGAYSPGQLASELAPHLQLRRALGPLQPRTREASGTVRTWCQVRRRAT
jgi:hypothetical protein